MKPHKTVSRSTQTIESQAETLKVQASVNLQQLQSASKSREFDDISRENDHLRRKYETLLHHSARERDRLLDETHRLQTYIMFSGSREIMLTDRLNNPFTKRESTDLTHAVIADMSAEMQLMHDRVAPLRSACAHFMHRYARELQQSEAIRADYERKMTDAGLAFNTELQFSQSKVVATREWLDSKDIKLPTLFESMSFRDPERDGAEISVNLGPKKRKEFIEEF